MNAAVLVITAGGVRTAHDVVQLPALVTGHTKEFGHDCLCMETAA